MVTKLEAAIIRRVARARIETHLTHKEAGEVLSLSETGYGHYERERQPFTVEQLFLLSRVLGHSVEHFLGIDNGLTPDEDELLARYQALPPEQARWFLDSLRGAMRGQDE